MVNQIGPRVLAQLLQQPNPPVIIDVREPHEYAFARIPGAALHVLGGIREWSSQLDRNAAYVVVCHHGARSHMACQFLQAMGFANVTNLDGGTDAWSIEVDPTLPRY